jgi:hypothetical protein
MCVALSRAVIAALAASFVPGCSLIVGDATRVLAAGDAGQDVESGADVGQGVPVDAPVDALVDAPVDTRAVPPVDSGGPAPACSPLCDDGQTCRANQDCASQLCQNGRCEPPVCAYLIPKCNDGSSCGASGDCASQSCVAGHCAAPSCAPSCSHGSPCGENGDCGPPHMCVGGSCK